MIAATMPGGERVSVPSRMAKGRRAAVLGFKGDGDRARGREKGRTAYSGAAERGRPGVVLTRKRGRVGSLCMSTGSCQVISNQSNTAALDQGDTRSAAPCRLTATTRRRAEDSGTWCRWQRNTRRQKLTDTDPGRALIASTHAPSTRIDMIMVILDGCRK